MSAWFSRKTGTTQAPEKREAARQKAIGASPEWTSLSDDWTCGTEYDNDRLWFQKLPDGPKTWVNPTLGPLPEPWILKLVETSKTGWQLLYVNEKTREKSTKDPRFLATTLAGHSKAVPSHLRIAASAQLNTNKIDMSRMQRAPIGKEDVRRHYEIIHTIDPGDGSKGGMNGGIFVVSMKGVPGKLYIEKRFRKEHVDMAKPEVKMMRHLNHPALTNFVYAFFIDEPTPYGSVYVEFCDRGDLDGIIKEYSTRNGQNPQPRPPEAFVWHAFGGLLDGLTYLQTGAGQLHGNGSKPRGWMPILHRDMKPDNVLLRSRSTAGSNRYFYCVLSDFGLACENRPPSDPACEEYQRRGITLGTSGYFAPELCIDPYPKKKEVYFPKGRDGKQSVHTHKSDLWALGISIFLLCESKGVIAHLDLENKPKELEWEYWMSGKHARRLKGIYTIPSAYTPQLRELVQEATCWSLARRPDPVGLCKLFTKNARASGFDRQKDNPPLHDWATRKHEYYSKK